MIVKTLDIEKHYENQDIQIVSITQSQHKAYNLTYGCIESLIDTCFFHLKKKYSQVTCSFRKHISQTDSNIRICQSAWIKMGYGEAVNLAPSDVCYLGYCRFSNPQFSTYSISQNDDYFSKKNPLH